MPTKEEIEEELNEKLDAEIEWSRLTRDDIVELKEMVDDGSLMDKLMRHMVSKYGRDELDRRVRNWQPGDLIRRMI